jgi:DNA-binding NtrC family response regulator
VNASFLRGSKDTVLSLDDAESSPLSIRAKSLVFIDESSRKILELIERVAPSDAPIIIEGDSGTGKELVARHVHLLSGRKGPFLAVNCGAISDQLAESELFGHETGAFTGATKQREGWFEAASHGTLFLDEVGDLPLPLQVKLLRVLQEQEVVRIGSRRPIPVDVRIVTATNIDLSEAVSAGHFRLDLYYRLNTVRVRMPSLRERVGDIMPLARHFLGVYSRKLKLPEPEFGEAAVCTLQAYAWPGNIRELENVIHFALLLSSGREIGPEHLKLDPIAVDVARLPSRAHASPAQVREPLGELRAAVREACRNPCDALFNTIEATVVNEAFIESGRNQVQAAALLGITRNVLRTLLKKHGLLTGARVPEPDHAACDS